MAENPATPSKKRPLWRRILKAAGIAAACVAGLFLLVCTLIVWILTPGRLTPMVEKQASHMLDAEVNIDRIELTFWHTFPKLTVDVEGLEVMSHSLWQLPDSVKATLPADADSLLTLKSFHAGLNVLPLLAGRISLYDVVFTAPSANLVQVNETVANYLIFPTDTTATDEPDSGMLSLPSISINRFAILDAAPLRYRSLADSTDIAVSLSTIELKGNDAPLYTLGISGDMRTPLLDDFNFERLTFGADGKIDWAPETPLAISLKDFVIALHDYRIAFDTNLDFTASPMVNSFTANTSEIPVAELLTHLPAHARGLAEPLQSDLRLKAAFSLTKPWNMADTVMPSFTASAEIPSCAVRYDDVNFHDFAVEVQADFDGTRPDASVFTLKRLHIDGEVIELDADASVTYALSDPLIDGKFKGVFDFGRLPLKVRQLIPGKIAGRLSGESDFHFRAGDFSQSRFHRLKLKGALSLDEFSADLDSLGSLYTRSSELRFGSGNSFIANGHQIDSLLTVSFRSDTLSAFYDGLDIQFRGLKAGGGTPNRSSSADTTIIQPFGVKFAFDRLSVDSKADSLHLRLRNASAGASLTRYKGDVKVPRMGLKISLDRMYFGQSMTKFALKKADIDMTVHMNPPRQRTHADTLRIAAARARRDSLGGKDATPDNSLRLGADERKFLRRWNFSGLVKAESGRMVTPAFPIRNRLENIDFKFNQDSLQLRNLHYTAGESDFLINGSVTNLRRALTARRDNTLGLRLMVMSDTINVNQLIKALFAGGAMSETADSAIVWSEDGHDDELIAAETDTAASGPVLLPRNIDAIFAMRAKNVLYSDLQLHSFRGDLLVTDGVLNLRNLSASTDVGDLRVDGMYSATAPDSLRFGLGLKVSDFRLDRLNSVIPAIDSILPAMKSFAGIVNADVAVTTDISPQMDIEIPSLKAAVKIEGDSLVLIDPDTFKTLSKWLLFRDKKKNLINHMAVEVMVENSAVEVYPFMFDIDRYRLGVMGHNDMAMNLNYHVSVLKSPLPFKFGINIKGTPDNMKIRLGGAKIGNKMVGERQAIAADTRINLVEQINSMFRSGINKARSGQKAFSPAGKAQGEAPSPRRPQKLSIAAPGGALVGEESISLADSLRMIREGLIENPDTTRFPISGATLSPVEKNR